MNDDDGLSLILSDAQETGQIFAVVDAAHFESLQDRLTIERFRFDPLYLDELDNPSIALGPHLVHPTGPSQIATLREIIGDAPACVWWVWPDVPDAGAAIYRHLRGLNMVEVPKYRPDRDDGIEGEHGYEAVLFRHADPIALAQVIRTLSKSQLRRLLGPAEQIVAPQSETAVPAVFVQNQSDLSTGRATRGMLRIGGDGQYDAIVDARVAASDERIITYLRDVAPQDSEPLSDDEMQRRVTEYRARARENGVVSEAAVGRWCFLELSTNGRFSFVPGVKDYLREKSPASIDDKVYLLLDSVGEAAKRS